MYKYLTKLSVCLLACVMLLGFAALPARAAVREDVDSMLESFPEDQWPAQPELNSQAAVIMEVNTGVMLYAKNATASSFPASTTKIMTGLLAVENCSMNDIVTISQKAISSLTPGSSHIGLKAGEQLTVQQCMYGLLLPSANEVAYALAEQVSGNVKEFASLMNARAAELGCVNTHFTNPSGLHDPQHYTCAYDLAKIFSACAQNSAFMAVDSTPTYVLPPTNLTGEVRPMATTHLMLRKGSPYYSQYVLGGKTGSTPEAGRCLVTYAKKDSLEIIVVTLHGEDSMQYADTQKLLDYAFSHFSCVRPSDAGAAGKTQAVSPLASQTGELASFHMDGSSLVVLPDTLQFSDLKAEASYQQQENGTAGTLTYTYQGYPLGKAVLMASAHEEGELIYKKNTQTQYHPAEEALEQGSRLIVLRLWLLILGAVVLILMGLGIYLLARFFSPRNRNDRKRRQKRGRLRY